MNLRQGIEKWQVKPLEESGYQDKSNKSATSKLLLRIGGEFTGT